MSMPGANNNCKKQREIYVGNLTIGAVSDALLGDLFNRALIHLVPDSMGNLPEPGTIIDAASKHHQTLSQNLGYLNS